MRRHGRPIYAAWQCRLNAHVCFFALSKLSNAQRLRRLFSVSSHKEIQDGFKLRSIATSRTRQPRVFNVVEDTIYALSTAPGRAAIAVIRISGSATVDIYKALCPGTPLPKPRLATVRPLHSPTNPDVLDPSALVLFFPCPHSVTGEDVLELHVHGGPALIQAVLRAIPHANHRSDGSRIRYAEAGEFARRAFLNDRLTLPQAEALGDLLAASTEQQHRRAVGGASGALTARYEAWRRLLLEARGELEALIDFAEDQQFAEPPAVLLQNVSRLVGELRERVRICAENAVRGELLRNGISVAIIGRPNAGKSSLLNLIVGREAAIVSPEMGTTRDILEVTVDLGGYLCRFVDTAGLRSSSFLDSAKKNDVTESSIGTIEQEGIRRAKKRALDSDVVVVLLSYERNTNGQLEVTIDPEIMDMASKCLENGSKVIIAINKSDLFSLDQPDNSDGAQETLLKAIKEKHDLKDIPIIKLSCKLAVTDDPSENTKSGLKSLMDNLIETFQKMTTAIQLETDVGSAGSLHLADTSEWEESLGGSDRQRLLLEECTSHLDSYLTQIYHPNAMEFQNFNDTEIDIVLAAENLRAAADSLAKITGRGESGDVEEVLGVVFQKFCVGK